MDMPNLAACTLILVACSVTQGESALERSARLPDEKTMLISTEQLNETLDDGGTVILDVRTAEEFSEGHIPGAHLLAVSEWKAAAFEPGGMQDKKGWAKRVGGLGIGNDTRVVLYGGKLSDAARAWWLLKYVGVTDVRLLDGGWPLWEREKRPASQAVAAIGVTEFEPKFQLDRVADIALVKDSQGSEDVKIVDTRSDDEFVAGRIPGAVHLEWKQLLNEDGRFKSRKQLDQLFRDQGINPTHTAVCY